MTRFSTDFFILKPVQISGVRTSSTHDTIAVTTKKHSFKVCDNMTVEIFQHAPQAIEIQVKL